MKNCSKKILFLSLAHPKKHVFIKSQNNDKNKFIHILIIFL